MVSTLTGLDFIKQVNMLIFECTETAESKPFKRENTRRRGKDHCAACLQLTGMDFSVSNLFSLFMQVTSVTRMGDFLSFWQKLSYKSSPMICDFWGFF